jgi:hypothetical protein
VVVLAHRLDGHRVGLYPGRGVTDIIRGLDAEIVGLVRLAQEHGLGLGGGRQPAGPGPTGSRLVLHVVVTHAALVIPAPGDGETQRGHAGQVDGDGQGPDDDVAGASTRLSAAGRWR